MFTCSSVSSSQEKYLDTSVSDEEDLHQSDSCCHEPDEPSRADGDGKHLARRKLLIACAVSLVFMIGEVIGKMTNVCLTS